jgi:uncharacterized membrane protein
MEVKMAESEGYVVYAGEYPDLDTAENDFLAIKELHDADFIGKYDAALFTKKENGKVKIVDTDESSRARGATGGAIAGAVLGVLFPPSIIGMAAGGGAIGAILGHVSGGIPRGDIKELGELLDEGEAGIVLVGESTIEEGLDGMLKNATKEMKKEIDANADDLKKELDAAVQS